MIPDNVIYTDGHNVTITDTQLKVKKRSYKFNGITKHGMFILKPRKLPAILLAAIGVVLAVIGFMGLLPPNNVPAIETAEGIISANTVVVWIGLSLTIIGALVLAILKKKYALRIDTAEGERNIVESTNRAYITQIVDALNEAIYRMTTKPKPEAYQNEKGNPVADDEDGRTSSKMRPVVRNPEPKENPNPPVSGSEPQRRDL